MSNRANDTGTLKRDGQSQLYRMPALLHPGNVPIDDRGLKDMLAYLFTIAQEINYFDHTSLKKPDAANTDGNWQEILNSGEESFDLLWNKLKELQKTRSVPPHLSLLLTFLELYNEPKRLMNALTGRHLDFYYHEVLGLKKKDPVPDKVHILFELKKNSEPVLLKANETKLNAGKDKLKKELNYCTTHDIIVNNSKVEQMRSLLVSPINKNHLHFAAVANSADGLGAELDKNNLKWNAFGHDKLLVANAGFCLASDVLLMKEGKREIIVKLDLRGSIPNINNGDSIPELFSVSLTGEKGWTPIIKTSPEITLTNKSGIGLSFTVTLSADDPAIIAYDDTTHGGGFETDKPVLKILLNNNNKLGYIHFKSQDLLGGEIKVNITGMNSLELENDIGPINSKKPFFPFGPMPEREANFWIGDSEVFTKQLSSLRLNIEWKNIPTSDLGSYYSGYGISAPNDSFTVNATFKDAGGWLETNVVRHLFDSANATKKDTDNISVNIEFKKNQSAFQMRNVDLYNDFVPEILVRSSGFTIRQELAKKSIQISRAGIFNSIERVAGFSPVRDFPGRIKILRRSNAILKEGFLHLALNQGFFFRKYKEVFTKQVLDFSKAAGNPTITPINEPFAPEVQRMTLDYSASTGPVPFTDNSLNDYSGTSIEFYHVGAFGQMREHAYLRQQTAFLNHKPVKFLPQYDSEGNFFIGLSGLSANESVCLLFQCAEGSADPALPKVNLQWSVLCDNYWKGLTAQDLIFDTTNGLLTSGVVKLVIPREATTLNTIMPDGFLWLKISIAQFANAVCNLIDVKANAAIAVFCDNGNDPAHLKTPLPAKTISKLETPNGSIKSVLQPYASFGGQTQEDSPAFYTRVSERLRHKERSVSVWDYERLLLQHFPGLHKVKCIAHASSSSFSAAGETLTVVIPDLKNQNAINPFQPGVDKNTLEEIKEFLNDHSTAWATHSVANPFYEPVMISVNVKMKAGNEFTYYAKELDKVLKDYLSPWVNNTSAGIHFGGKITESQIVKLVEDLEYVDFITGLKLFHKTGSAGFQLKKHVIEASGPASVLVSHTMHDIKQS